MRKILLIHVLLLCSALQMSAQEPPPVLYASVSGTVLREHLGSALIPIQNATVQLRNDNYDLVQQTGISIPYYIVDSTKTDGNGSFAFDRVVVGNGYTLTVSAKGYRSEQMYLMVQKDTVLHFELTPYTKFYSLTGRVSIDCPLCGGVLPIPLAACTVRVQFPVMFIAQPALIIAPDIQTSFSAVTKEDGTYLIDSIPAEDIYSYDSVSVTASKRDFVTQIKWKKLHAQRIDTLNFSLVRVSTPLVHIVNSFEAAGLSANYSRANGKVNLILDRSQKVSMHIFRPDGKLVETVMEQQFVPAGIRSISLNRGSLGRGMFLIRIEGTQQTRIVPMHLY